MSTTEPARLPQTRLIVPGMSDQEIKFERMLHEMAREHFDGHDSVAVLTQPRTYAHGRLQVPDFIITNGRRTFALQIDDPTHYGRAVADLTKDYLLQDCGVLPHRIPYEDVHDPERAQQHIRRLVAWMGRPAA